MSNILPSEITRANEHDIKIIWSDNVEDIYPPRFLRLRCRCAQCVEEMTGRPLLDPNTVPENITATSLKLVGRYGLQIWWSDGHSTGIYTFNSLREYGKELRKK